MGLRLVLGAPLRLFLSHPAPEMSHPAPINEPWDIYEPRAKIVVKYVIFVWVQAGTMAMRAKSSFLGGHTGR